MIVWGLLRGVMRVAMIFAHCHRGVFRFSANEGCGRCGNS